MEGSIHVEAIEGLGPNIKYIMAVMPQGQLVAFDYQLDRDNWFPVWAISQEYLLISAGNSSGVCRVQISDANGNLLKPQLPLGWTEPVYIPLGTRPEPSIYRRLGSRETVVLAVDDLFPRDVRVL